MGRFFNEFNRYKKKSESAQEDMPKECWQIKSIGRGKTGHTAKRTEKDVRSDADHGSYAAGLS